MDIIKSDRHSKHIGNFGESFLCNWLSRSGFEVAVIDHTGFDVIAYNKTTQDRLGITVKSRTRTPKSERNGITIFNYPKETDGKREKKDDRQKLLDACNAFGCTPWVAVYIETTISSNLYLASLTTFDAFCRKQSSDGAKKKQDVWKLTKNDIKAYSGNADILHLSLGPVDVCGPYRTTTWGDFRVRLS